MSARAGRLAVASFALVAMLAPGLGACSHPEEKPTKDNAAVPSASAAPVASIDPFAQGPMLADDQLRIVEPPSGDDVTAIVKDERARQAALGRQLLVYAGAKWCEPCQHFHRAAASGKLDKAFPKLTVLEFDVDHDGDRLKRAGYTSHYIPLFIVPDADGKPTDHRLEGSIKGNGAVDEIVPRLQKILGS